MISVPIFIKKLGVEMYGVFALVSVIGNLNMLTNFGLNRSLLVYIAKQGKCRESDHDILTTQFLLTIILLPLLLIIILFKQFITAEILSVPPIYYIEAESLVVFITIANTILLLGQTYSAVLDAQQKIFITNTIQFLYSFLYWIGLIVVVSVGGSLKEIGFVVLFSSILWFILILLSFYKSWGKIDITEFIANFKYSAKKQFVFGTKIYLSGLIGFLFEPLSKLLLSRYIGLNSVAMFEIGLKIKGIFSGLFSKLLYPFLPFIAKSSTELSIKIKIFDFSKKIQLIVIPFSILVAFVMSFFAKLWLGYNYNSETTIFIIVLTTVIILFSPPVLPIYQYLAANNMAIKNVWVQLISVVFNTVIFFVAYKKFGAYAILLSNSLGFIASYALCNYYQIKYLNINLKQELPFYGKLLFFGFGTSIICLFTKSAIPLGWWDLVIYPVIVLSISIIFIRYFKLITSNDLETYFDSMPQLKSFMSKLLIA